VFPPGPGGKPGNPPVNMPQIEPGTLVFCAFSTTFSSLIRLRNRWIDVFDLNCQVVAGYESSPIVREKEYALFNDVCEVEGKNLRFFSFHFTNIIKKGFILFGEKFGATHNRSSIIVSQFCC
jgi:hypothetical protein